MFLPAFVDVDEFLVHLESEGPPDGEPALFLHGWPDLWFSFEDQMHALAERGYRVMAPDLRGYGLTGKPVNVEEYELAHLVFDVIKLLERLGTGPVHLVGHDWGGVVAWSLALARPDLVASLTVVNAPHPLVFRHALTHDPRQMLRSWYMFAFQVPGLAEAVLTAADHAVLAGLLRRGAGVDEATMARHRLIWEHPGTIARPLYYYRALFRSQLRGRGVPLPAGPVEPPTQIIWGRHDPVFRPGLAEASALRCRQADVHLLEARHWPHHDQPSQVTEMLARFFARTGAASRS